MRRKPPARSFLFMRLGRAPKWWPRDARGKVKPVGILSDGSGWVEGEGQLMTAAQRKEAIELLRMDYSSNRPEFFTRRV